MASTERWAVSCGCDYHGDHLGCDASCEALGCVHPVGQEVTADTEEEANELSGKPLDTPEIVDGLMANLSGKTIDSTTFLFGNSDGQDVGDPTIFSIKFTDGSILRVSPEWYGDAPTDHWGADEIVTFLDVEYES